MGLSSPKVIPKEKLCQPWLRSAKDLQVLLPPTDCSQDSCEGVAVKLRHDAYLSASSHLFRMPGSKAERASPKL
ncbi:hypothetical protein EVAR_71923_1 [Eumeta japonica]|uniref:Uncharacterized protein n=1 Tax=Eumeta variegata TaxID=151549 RepID=A0A4C1SMV4_EUMVA|nr:hypothetical protein EVAR_71923_1 [Eumeta japonica]